MMFKLFLILSLLFSLSGAFAQVVTDSTTVPGDADANKVLSIGDISTIATFVALKDRYDTNNDGIVDALDLRPLILCVFAGQSCDSTFDINLSGRVDVGDINTMGSYLNNRNSYDPDRNCVVDLNDVYYLINFMFYNGPPAKPGCVVVTKNK